MKKIGFICLLVAALHARADMVIVLSTDIDGVVQKTTVKIKGSKVRNEVSVDKDGKTNWMTITDLASGASVFILPNEKKFAKQPTAPPPSREELLKDTKNDPLPDAPPQLADSGKKEKVNGFDAEIYTADTPAATYTFWVVKDYADGAALAGSLGDNRLIGGEDRLFDLKALNLYPDISKLDGIIIKTKIVFKRQYQALGNPQTATDIIISAKIQPLEDAEFQVPSDYKEDEMLAPSYKITIPAGMSRASHPTATAP